MQQEIFVFRTSVNSAHGAELLAPHLRTLIGVQRWNFDLQDCDRILRVVSQGACSEAIIATVQQHGFLCEPLEDVVESFSL